MASRRLVRGALEGVGVLALASAAEEEFCFFDGRDPEGRGGRELVVPGVLVLEVAVPRGVSVVTFVAAVPRGVLLAMTVGSEARVFCLSASSFCSSSICFFRLRVTGIAIGSRGKEE